MARIVGEIKRLPFQIGGVRLARLIRPVLYESRFGPMFQMHRLKYTVMAVAGLYALVALSYWISILIR